MDKYARKDVCVDWHFVKRRAVVEYIGFFGISLLALEGNIMKKKRIVAFAMAIVMALLVMPILPSIASEPGEPNDVFFDDFSDDELDSAKWIVANKAWGGNNGGVVAENVSVSDGTLKLEGHGLQYKGDVMGVGKRGDGTLVGAAIATREYYASGSYEVIAKIAPDLGACSAMWTFEYEEYYPGQEGYIPEKATYGYCTVNHEIDIEIPTANVAEQYASGPKFKKQTITKR